MRAITVEGMEGRLPFRESVERRLALAKPTLTAIEEFGRDAVDLLTPGIAAMIGALDAEIWIVSGALRETLLPVAAHLGVSGERVLGTTARWEGDELAELVDCREKAGLLAGRTGAWGRPRVMVGDGMSDVAVHTDGLVDHFIAFTGHVRREPVVATGAPEARDVAELEYLLRRLL